MKNYLSPIEEIIKEAKTGKMFILVDAEDRENEGDLVIPAVDATPDMVNFMAKYGRGLVCLPLSEEKADHLNLKLMSDDNKSRHKTPFTVSIEAKEGISTGISAKDRSTTIQTAINPQAREEDIVTPGHIFPLKAKDGGVLVRAGHTEAAVDISRLAGKDPSAVIGEIMNDDGTMARRDDLIKFGEEHNIKVGTIADLIDYRLSSDSTVEAVNERDISNEFGEFKLIVWRDIINDEYHFSLSKGDLTKVKSPLVRVQTQSILQDTLGIEELGKNWSIRKSLERISEEEAGLFVLINHRDAKSYWLNLLDDKEIEPKRNRRVIGVGSQILRALNLKEITVLGTPTKYNAVSGFNIEITGFVNE